MRIFNRIYIIKITIASNNKQILYNSLTGFVFAYNILLYESLEDRQVPDVDNP